MQLDRIAGDARARVVQAASTERLAHELAGKGILMRKCPRLIHKLSKLDLPPTGPRIFEPRCDKLRFIKQYLCVEFIVRHGWHDACNDEVGSSLNQFIEK